MSHSGKPSATATDGSTAMIVPGTGGLILRSTNGTTWSTVTSGVTDDLEGATFGAGKYIVTGANGRVLQTDGEDMIQREHSCFFRADHAAKDSHIALSLAQDAASNGRGMRPPVSPSGHPSSESQVTARPRPAWVVPMVVGAVALLTREGEIEIAKRIEGGLKDMVQAISACPTTIAEIIALSHKIAKDELKVDEVVDGFVAADEADDYVGMWTEIDLAKHEKVSSIYLVSATIDEIVEKHKYVKVLPFSTTFPPCYRKLEDCHVERIDGAWKMVDFSVFGARMVETYKNQFNGAVAADGLDGLIKTLSNRNQTIESRARS